MAKKWFIFYAIQEYIDGRAEKDKCFHLDNNKRRHWTVAPPHRGHCPNCRELDHFMLTLGRYWIRHENRTNFIRRAYNFNPATWPTPGGNEWVSRILPPSMDSLHVDEQKNVSLFPPSLLLKIAWGPVWPAPVSPEALDLAADFVQKYNSTPEASNLAEVASSGFYLEKELTDMAQMAFQVWDQTVISDFFGNASLAQRDDSGEYVFDNLADMLIGAVGIVKNELIAIHKLTLTGTSRKYRLKVGMPSAVEIGMPDSISYAATQPGTTIAVGAANFDEIMVRSFLGDSLAEQYAAGLVSQSHSGAGSGTAGALAAYTGGETGFTKTLIELVSAPGLGPLSFGELTYTSQYQIANGPYWHCDWYNDIGAASVPSALKASLGTFLTHARKQGWIFPGDYLPNTPPAVNGCYNYLRDKPDAVYLAAGMSIDPAALADPGFGDVAVNSDGSPKFTNSDIDNVPADNLWSGQPVAVVHLGLPLGGITNSQLLHAMGWVGPDTWWAAKQAYAAIIGSAVPGGVSLAGNITSFLDKTEGAIPSIKFDTWYKCDTFRCEIPAGVNATTTAPGTPYINIVPRYNFYIPTYETKIASPSIPETVLPCLYAFMADTFTKGADGASANTTQIGFTDEDGNGVYDPAIDTPIFEQNGTFTEYYNLISLGGSIRNSFTDIQSAVGEKVAESQHGEYYDKWSSAIDVFSAGQAPSAQVPVRAGPDIYTGAPNAITLDALSNKWKNVMIPAESFDEFTSDQSTKKLYPMYVDIEFGGGVDQSSGNSGFNIVNKLKETGLLDEILTQWVKSYPTIPADIRQAQTNNNIDHTLGEEPSAQYQMRYTSGGWASPYRTGMPTIQLDAGASHTIRQTLVGSQGPGHGVGTAAYLGERPDPDIAFEGGVLSNGQGAKGTMRYLDMTSWFDEWSRLAGITAVADTEAEDVALNNLEDFMEAAAGIFSKLGTNFEPYVTVLPNHVDGEGRVRVLSAYGGGTGQDVDVAALTGEEELEAIDRVMGLMKFAQDFKNFVMDEMNPFMTSPAGGPNRQSVPGALCSNYSLSYRIEKMEEDEFGNWNTIQNFYLPEVYDEAGLGGGRGVKKFVDTQVKYNKKYKYKIWNHRLVIGTQYKYVSNSIDWFRDFNSATNSIRTGVEFDAVWKPVLRVYEVPFYAVHNQPTKVIDHPPIFPDVNILQHRGKSDRILFHLNGNVGKYAAVPIPILPDEASFLADIPNSPPYRESGGRLVYKSDDFPTIFEIFRMDTKPSSYDDFADKLWARHNTNGEATSASFLDTVRPNKKYYYMFRCIDNHGHTSNPTMVFEVEMVDDGGTVFQTIKEYNMATEENTKPSRSIRRYVEIKPALEQMLVNLEASNIDTSTNDFSSEPWLAEELQGAPTAGDPQSVVVGTNVDLTDIQLGPDDDAIWTNSDENINQPAGRNGKRFKVRFTSRATGRKFDLNLAFKIKYKNPIT